MIQPGYSEELSEHEPVTVVNIDLGFHAYPSWFFSSQF